MDAAPLTRPVAVMARKDTCVCMYICVCMCMCVYVFVFVCVYVHVCMYTRAEATWEVACTDAVPLTRPVAVIAQKDTCVCMCVCMYVCMCVGVCICVCVCVCVRMSS